MANENGHFASRVLLDLDKLEMQSRLSVSRSTRDGM